MAVLICTACGTQGNPKTRVKGSFLVEIILWMFFLFPGAIYTVWRLTTKEKVCRTCGANTLVPLNSPMGRKLLAELSNRSEPVKAVTQDVPPLAPVVLPSVETFINDDQGYQDWLDQHPDGFVLHCYRHRPQSSMTLHQATCEMINKASQPGEFTSKL
jgi:hypothetical protein